MLSGLQRLSALGFGLRGAASLWGAQRGWVQGSLHTQPAYVPKGHAGSAATSASEPLVVCGMVHDVEKNYGSVGDGVEASMEGREINAV
jgi:hypothetical protein